jgi:hypothetical protein
MTASFPGKAYLTRFPFSSVFNRCGAARRELVDEVLETPAVLAVDAAVEVREVEVEVDEVELKSLPLRVRELVVETLALVGVLGNGFTVAVERPLSVLELVSELKRDAASLRVILAGRRAPVA